MVLNGYPTKDKLENLAEKMELMEIRSEQRHMEILIVLESLKANASVASFCNKWLGCGEERMSTGKYVWTTHVEYFPERYA